MLNVATLKWVYYAQREFFLLLLQADLRSQKFTKAQKHELLFDFARLLTSRVFLSKSALERKKRMTGYDSN